MTRNFGQGLVFERMEDFRNLGVGLFYEDHQKLKEETKQTIEEGNKLLRDLSGNSLEPTKGIYIITKEPTAKDLIASSIIDKDITEEVGQQLLLQYENTPSELLPLLKEFSKERIRYLMSLDWNELDKGDYAQELVEKYYTGYKLKRYLQFGKKSNGSVDNSAFLKFAIDNRYIPENYPTWNLEETPANTKEVIFNKIYALIEQSTQSLINLSWENSTDTQLERLKQEAFASYKQKYLQHFGVKYTQPFELKK